MTFRVEIKPVALREIARLPKADQRRIAARIDGLADNPRPPGCVKLAGAGDLWRLRAGDYRIIYDIDDIPRVVAVIKVGHRREICRGL